MSRRGKSIETGSRVVVVRVWRKRNCFTGFPFGVMEMFWKKMEVVTIQY
jgi:hypothetical protein